MTAHSKAPWTADNGRILSAGGRDVALVSLRPGIGADEFTSNRSILRAAPEMREAVTDVALLLDTELRHFRAEPWAVRLLALHARLRAEETAT